MRPVSGGSCQVVLACCGLVLWLAGLNYGIPDPVQRDRLIQQEASRQVGGSVALTAAEKRLDAHLRQLKEKEMAAAQFPPAMHFFRAKPLIQNSAIFKLLQKMPKGGALHVHGSALVSAEWLVRNATYRPHCYACFTWDGSVRFLFSLRQPLPRWDCFLWRSLDALRAAADDVSRFDDGLIRSLTLFTEEPEAAYPSQDAVWESFERAFVVAAGLVTHAPVLRDYLHRGLEELYHDNIMYLELRSGLSRTYELDGTINDKTWSLKNFREVTERFKLTHPDFLGARIIVCAHRALGVAQVRAAVEEAAQMQKDFPDVVAGFDLVGREDRGRTLWFFREALAPPYGLDLPFFFHAGETDEQGAAAAAQNILDALLFNTSRIGHGYALAQHPLARELARHHQVAIELCPISNQVLQLVSDLRKHPGSVLMAEGLPLVVSSDDPAMFGNPGLSYDFYQVLVGLGRLSSGLGTLKELAANSLRFSALPPHLKEAGLTAWNRKWDSFISEQDASSLQ